MTGHRSIALGVMLLLALGGIPLAVIGLALSAVVRRSNGAVRAASLTIIKVAAFSQIATSLLWLAATFQLAVFSVWDILWFPATACALTTVAVAAWFRLLSVCAQPEEFPRLVGAP